MAAFATGFGLGLSLIVVIGAQNAFVLRQGLLRRFVLPVVLVCAVSDALLIAAGVGGFGLLVDRLPWLATVLRWGGVAFLVAYGARSFRAARAGSGALDAGQGNGQGLIPVLLTCLAFTWLNPHVWLDTVVLIGSVARGWPGRELAFGIGAASASFAFFFALGYGARLLAPLFARPNAWRVLDAGIGVVMWAIAAQLAFNG
ncbi:MAG: amino acid transporter [Rubellimicrobium sp.]|nr:amino acid transporter [Rubellimicrobium sp.]